MSKQTLLCFAVAAAALPAATLAQSGDQPAREAGTLEEVIVTAERREGSLQEVPIAVTALSAQALEDRQVIEARDLQRFVPSLRMSNNITSPTNLSPSLRGSLQQDASLVVAESPFGIYVDDVYIGRLNGNNVTLADIQSVEVLRGPQGTLYGRNTLAGAIKFTSRTPGEQSWLIARVGAGNWDQYVANVSIGGPLSDNWAGSFAAQINSKDGQTRNLATGEKTGLERNVAARAKLRYMGSETFDAVLSLSHSDSTNDSNQLLPGISPSVPANQRYTSDDVILPRGMRNLATPTVARQPSIISDRPRGDTKQTIASANLAWKFDGYTLRSITGYVKTDDYFMTDFSGEGQVIGASNPMADQFTQELQIQGVALGDRLNYLAGVYYLNEKGDQDFGWNITRPFFNVGAVSTSQIRAKTDSISVFGEASFQITDALKATAGVRWVRDDKSFDFGWQALFAPIPPATVSLDNTYSQTTPKFGLDWKVDSEKFDSLLLYASVARGFKSGGYNGINITDPLGAFSPYGPEKNWTYELGMKADMADRRVRLNAAAFVAKITDLTLNATVILPNGTASFPVQNSGDATVRGLELESTIVPTENLTFYANLALLDGKYDRLNPTSAPAIASLPRVALGVNNNRLGVRAEPPQLPQYTFTIGFDYGIPVPVGPNGGRFKVGFDWYRTDDYITAATNDFVITAYDRLNGYVGLEIGDNWDVRLAARNLDDSDKIYVGSRGFLGGYLVLPPREVLFSVTYSR